MGEHDFDNMTIREQPNSDSGKSAIDVTGLNDYQFIEEAYNGNEGFKNGKYLIPHQREMLYDTRRQFSSYVNYIKPIVNAMIDPVFNKKMNRTTDNKLCELFIEDCNYNGMIIQSFVEMVTRYVRLHKVAFVVMDNVNRTVESVKEAVSQNIKPYVYLRKAYQVESYDTDKFGKLISITFIENKIKIGNTDVQTYRYWDKTQTILFKKSDNGQMVEIESPVIHGLGVLPVMSFYDNNQDNADDILPFPNLYNMAKLNHTIYNQDSERRELQRNQGFAILYVQEDQNNIAGKAVGTTNYISLGTDITIPPGFIAPPAELLKSLAEEREGSRTALFQLAEQNGVIGVSKDAKSGVALSYEFQAYESTLVKTSEIGYRIEVTIIDMFKRWTKSSFTYDVIYPTEFKPQRDLEKVTIYETVLNYPKLPQQTRKRTLMATHALLFPDADQEELDTLEREIDEPEPEYNNDIIPSDGNEPKAVDDDNTNDNE